MQILSSEWIESLRFVVIAKRTKSYHVDSALSIQAEKGKRIGSMAHTLAFLYGISVCSSSSPYRWVWVKSLPVCWLCRMSRCPSSSWSRATLCWLRMCCSQMYVLLFTNLHLAVLKSPSCHRSPPSDWSFTAQWLIVHRPVTERSPPGDWSFNARWTMGKSSNRNGMD